jgi:hypothetical protein
MWYIQRVRQLTGLIPSLDCSSNRVEDDGEIEHSWVMPAFGLFKLQFAAFGFIEPFDTVEIQWVLCDEGAFLEKRENVGQLVLCRESLHVFEQLLPGQTE